MAAKKLRHRIALKSPTRTDDDDGKPVVTYTDAGAISANVKIIGASEEIEHRQPRGSIDATVEVRFSPTTEAIKSDWRFRFNGMVFEITAPPQDVEGLQKWIVIEAQAKPGLD